MVMLLPLQVSSGDVPPIPGLHYLPEYVSKERERSLAQVIDHLPWNTDCRLRRHSYGTGYGTTSAAPPIPDWGRELADRLYADGVTPQPCDHVLVNECLPGQGIALHRDYAPFVRTVVSLSLLSSCVMDFRYRPTGRRQSLLLLPRSVLVMSDEARYLWEHGI